MNSIIQKLGVFAAMLSAFLSASAYDFEVGGIFYNIINSTAKEVEVTYEDMYTASYSGDIVVPSSVSYNNERYTVTAIGESAFLGCFNLISITIPNTVTTIDIGGFIACSSLTSIAVDADNQKYLSIDGILYDKRQTELICCPGGKTGDITIPNTVTTIYATTFETCSLTNINVDIDNQEYSSVDGILDNKLQTKLLRCPGGKTGVIIPNTVTTIRDYAFYSCSNLTSITLPNSLMTIGYDAFNRCSLTSITSLAVTPPECGENVFGGVNMQRCTLYVPAESIDAYKQALGWKDFILVEGTSGIDLVKADPSADVEVFKLNGTRVSGPVGNLPAGIYIVREGSTARKIIIR